MKRESGFYWVRYKNEWIVAHWREPFGHWKAIGLGCAVFDSVFEEIDERRLQHGE